MPGSKTTPLAIGSDIWPGLSKLAEECGETVQIIGKIIAFPEGEHPDGQGPLEDRLTDEMADLFATIIYVRTVNDRIDLTRFQDRVQMKYERFMGWHKQEQGASE
jgi:NTP pyrophosphatase (non-canonical NTP hydrolase)